MELIPDSQVELQMLPHPPEHIFTDMTDCLADSIKGILLKEAARMTFEDLMKIIKSKRAITTSMYCGVHQRKYQCRRAMLHAAGTPCVAWSSQGQRVGTSGPTMLAFAAWVGQRLLLQEDAILHDNVPEFNVEVLKKIFEDMYIIESIVVCCSALGQPAERRRRLTWLRHKKSVVMTPSKIKESWTDFHHHFERNCLITWESYFELASEAELESELQWAMERPKLKSEMQNQRGDVINTKSKFEQVGASSTPSV